MITAKNDAAAKEASAGQAAEAPPAADAAITPASLVVDSGKPEDLRDYLVYWAEQNAARNDDYAQRQGTLNSLAYFIYPLQGRKPEQFLAAETKRMQDRQKELTETEAKLLAEKKTLTAKKKSSASKMQRPSKLI